MESAESCFMVSFCRFMAAWNGYTLDAHAPDSCMSLLDLKCNEYQTFRSPFCFFIQHLISSKPRSFRIDGSVCLYFLCQEQGNVDSCCLAMQQV